MKVETFECQETAAEPTDITDEALSLIESLGLDGQRSLTKPADGSNRAARVPYREMTADERVVYGVLCPTQTPVEQYSSSPMPIRVLQVAAHAKSLGIFEKLIVWDRASASVHDPVLVGERKNPVNEWQTDRFILARWGDELESWPTLVKRATDQLREELRAKLSQMANEATAALSRVDSKTIGSCRGTIPEAFFNTGGV